MWWILLPIAYLIGTFPSATLVARAAGIDIRAVGSGNPGASNVTRVLGWKRGVVVFALDAAKGALAAGIGLAVDGRPLGYAMGAAAIAGHVFPAWHRFRGGKGVATGGGVAAVMAPVVFALLAVAWFAVSRLTKRASVASIVMVALFPVGVIVTGGEPWEVLAVVAMCLLVVARHLGNIRRLVTRSEPTLVDGPRRDLTPRAR